MRTHSAERKLSRALVLLLLASLCISSVLAVDIDIPVATGDGVAFTAEDFTAISEDGERQLAGIVIAALPDAGTLSYAGRALLEGEAVATNTLYLMTYTPAQNGPRNAVFSYLPVYEDGTVDQVMTVSLTMQAVDNHPPMVQDVEVKTYKNVPVTGIFRGTDPEGDALTFRITGKPKRGEIEITSDGRFIYTPYHNKTGKDTVTYIAVDAYGNISADAKINIKIEKPSSKTTYADLSGHPAQYAALRLAGEGVYTGTLMCGSYYFKPEETVNRAELITMVVKAIGMEVTPVTATGFYDDAALPDWFKPYAQAALKAGIVSGVRSPDGRTVLAAGEPVTLSQAAAILNNAIRPAAVPLTDESGTVPAWSAQALANLDAVGIFDDIAASGDGDFDRVLTRGEVAMLLVRTIDAYNETQPKSGLLSWVFGW